MPSRIDTGVTGGAPNLLGSFTAAARPFDQNVDWEAFGTAHTPENCGIPWVWQECTTTEDGEKPLNPGHDAVEFRPFLVEYNAQSCGGIPGDWDQLADRAKRGLAVRVSNAIDRALSSAAPDGQPNQNPNLPDLAVDITPGTGPAGIIATIEGLLQDAFECGLTGEAWIHLPAWTIPLLLFNQLIVQVGNTYKLGPHTVIVDQGYANEPPTGSPVAVAGQFWVYITGPFEYATGPVTMLDDTTKGVTIRENRANVIAAQLAIYRFDPCCVFAALSEVC